MQHALIFLGFWGGFFLPVLLLPIAIKHSRKGRKTKRSHRFIIAFGASILCGSVIFAATLLGDGNLLFRIFNHISYPFQNKDPLYALLFWFGTPIGLFVMLLLVIMSTQKKPARGLYIAFFASTAMHYAFIAAIIFPEFFNA